MSDERRERIPEFVRRLINTGVGAAFMTEDAVRAILQELPLSKEAVNGILQNARSTRDEFVLAVKNEVKNYLKRIDLRQEVDRILQNYDVDVQATLKFRPKGEKKEEN